MKTCLTFLFSFFLFLNSTFSQITLSPAGNLIAPRWFHESQVLPNGKVLVFGGNNGNYSNLIRYKSSELYDPASNTWSGTGNMSHPRELCASVVLNNGKVLAIGGSGADTTSEIYDPATGLWSDVASMKEMNEKAIKLNDGRVLAVSMNTSEIYDPSTNKWQYADTLTVLHGRYFSLALLDDGKVLLTGGNNMQTAAELFDPITNSWTLLTNSMQQERKDHQSVKLADGKILLTNGDLGNSGCEIYDPTNNTFTLTGSMETNVSANPTILMDNGHVLVYGLGDFFNATDTKCLQTYNPSTGVWSAGGTYNFVGRNFYTINKLKNGNILIAGGSATTGNGASTDCLLVTPAEFSGCTAPNLALSLNSTSVCYGKSPAVTINGSESGVTYTAFISGTKASTASVGPGTLTLNLNASVLQPGTNIVSIFAKKAGCPTFILNNTTTINSTLSIASKPVLDPTGEVVVCSGDSIKLSAASGYSSYRWSNGKITTTPALVVKPNTFINVKYVDGTGCTSVASDFVNVFTPVHINGGAGLNTCDSVSDFLLTDYSPKGGTWSGPGVSPTGIFFPSSVGPGMHLLTYKVCNLTTTKKVLVHSTKVPTLTAHFIKDTICYSEMGTLEIENSDPWISYTLRDGNTVIGNTIGGNGGTISLSTSNVFATTNFNVLCTTSNYCGYLSSVSYYKIVVMPNPDLAVTVTDPLICKNGKTLVVINASQKDVSYQLKIGSQDVYNPVNGNGNSVKIEVGPLTTSQTYTISATYKTCYPRELVAKATVGVQQPLSYFAPHAFNVQPGQRILFENHSKNPSGTYNWNFGAGASIVTSSLPNPDSIYYAQPGSYLVSLITTSPLGCKDTLLQTVNVFSSNKTDSCAAARGHFTDANHGFPIALVNDKNDNTYLYGKTDGGGGQIKIFSKYSDTIRVGSTNTNFVGNILTKYNKKGIPDWVARIAYDSPWSRPGAVDVDSTGDVYLAYFHGDYLDSIRFYSVDNRHYAIKPPHDATRTSVVICKYNSKGYFQWVRTFMDYYTCMKTCVRVDKEFLYVGSERNFCKYNLKGDTLWQFYTPAPMNGGIREIEVDSKRNVHLLKKDFMHIEKYDPNGTLLSSTDPPTDLGGLYIESSHLKLDDQGNGYSAGNFAGNLSFAGNTYVSNTGANNLNGFLAAYDVLTGKQKWFIQLKQGSKNGELRLMGIDFKNGAGIVTGIVYSSNETLQIGTKIFQFQESGYFSFNFNASGNIYNFNVLTSSNLYWNLYNRNLATYNHLDNNTTVCFDYIGTTQYGGRSYPALKTGSDFIILKGNASCLSPVVTSVSSDLPVSSDPNAIKIFPNPASSGDEIYISVSSELKEKTTVSVTDVTGKRIGSTFDFSLNAGVNQIQIPADVTRELNAGVYFIQLRSSSVHQTMKLMIE